MSDLGQAMKDLKAALDRVPEEGQDIPAPQADALCDAASRAVEAWATYHYLVCADIAMQNSARRKDRMDRALKEMLGELRRTFTVALVSECWDPEDQLVMAALDEEAFQRVQSEMVAGMQQAAARIAREIAEREGAATADGGEGGRGARTTEGETE